MDKDEAGGLAIIREAATLGSKEAQFTLGTMYEKGRGLEVNTSRAEEYFRQCAVAGERACQYHLGKLLLDAPKRTGDEWLQAIA